MTTTTRWARAREVGWALRRSGPSQKIVARVLGLDPRRLSQQIQGLRESVASQFYEAVRKLTADPKCDPGALIAEAMMAAVDAASTLPEDEIRERLYRALDDEASAQAVEDQATHRLMLALARIGSPFATPEDLTELRDALEAHDHATQDETAAAMNALVYSRALRRARGWA